MFLKNTSDTYQDFSYNDGNSHRQIAPGKTVAIADAKDDDTSICTLISLGMVEIVDSIGEQAVAKESFVMADVDDESETEVAVTVKCSGECKNGNPCTTVITLGEGETYEDAPRFCGRHKNENPEEYELVNGVWTKTGGKKRDEVQDTPEPSAEDAQKPAEGEDGEGDTKDGNEAEGDVMPPLAPQPSTPVFDNE